MALSTFAGLRTARKERACIVHTGQNVAQGAIGSTWQGVTGSPGGVGVAPGNTTTGLVPTKATAGALWNFPSPVGSQKIYLNRCKLGYLNPGSQNQIGFVLVDRVWHAGAYTPAAASLGVTGTALTRWTTGDNVELFVEIQTATGAVAFTLTITYTNQSGTTGRTATITIPASAAIGRAYQVALAAGDTGVRQVTAATCSAATTGTYNLVLYRPLATINDYTIDTQSEAGVEFPWYLMLPEEIPDNACLSIIYLSTSNLSVASQIVGLIELAYG